MKKLKGLYLVINPKQSEQELLMRLREALEEGIAAVQMYNGWPKKFTQENKVALLSKVKQLCEKHATPFFINNEWELLKEIALDGVHFDKLPEGWPSQKSTIDYDFITGLTMTNDLSILENVKPLQIDYLSFCAMFPSASVGECEIVDPKNVEATLNKIDLPVFISGGITPENVLKFKNIPVSGVAVISGVMNSKDPKNAVKAYKKSLTKFK